MDEELVKYAKEKIEYIQNGPDRERIDSYKKDLMVYGEAAIRHIRFRKEEQLTEKEIDEYAKIVSMSFILRMR